MIEFNGNLTGNAKEYALKQIAKDMQKLYLIGTLSLVIPSLFCFYVFHNFLTFTLPIVFLILTIISKSFNQIFSRSLPQNISITSGEIVYQTSHSSQIIKVDSVKKVYDFGAYYDIVTTNILNGTSHICQKDLVVQGTLENFEEIFDGKIEKCN